MPAPNLIQNDVCAEKMAVEGSEKCCCECTPNRCAPCEAERVGRENIVQYSSGLQQNYENSVDKLAVDVYMDYLADGSEIVY